MLELLIGSFLFTWVGGLILPIILRFVILRKPTKELYAVLVAGVIFIIQLILAEGLGNKGHHTALLLVAFVSYWIMQKGNKNEEVESINKTELSIGTSLFKKSALKFWIILSGIVLLIISFGQQAGKRTLEDIQNQQNSLFPTFYLSSSLVQFIQIYIFCVSLYFAFLKYNDKKLDMTFAFIVVGVLFNPFVSFHFDNDFLNIIKLLTAVFFGYLAYKEYQKITKESV